MNHSPEADSEGPLLERIRRALAHDLRTPLGTISNYAAILEYHGLDKPEDVRVFAARIRASATRTVSMLQQMTDAIVLSRQKPSLGGMDPSVTLRALLSEFPIHVRFPARGHEPAERIPFDGDLITFAWRAFLSFNLERVGAVAVDLDLEVERADSTIAVDMFVGMHPGEPQERMDSTRFAQQVADHAVPEFAFALGLAEDLIRLRGGELALWGGPGGPSGLRIQFPRPK